MTTTAAGKDDRLTRWLRWVARGLGTLVAGFWLLVGIASAIGGRDPWTWQSTVLAVLIVTSALGAGIAWWREGPGGAILVLCGLAHSTFAYVVSGHHRGWAALFTGGPLLAAGALFLACWQRSRNRVCSP